MSLLVYYVNMTFNMSSRFFSAGSCALKGKAGVFITKGGVIMSHKFITTDEALHRACLRRELAAYEQAVVEQARGIVNGQSAAMPSHEHLRVLLQWLDGQATGARPRVVH